MARPLPTSEMPRGGANGNHQGRYSLDDAPTGPETGRDLEQLCSENEQLRSLCALEQALQEATQQPAGGPVDWDERAREYEALLDESETIRQLHQQLQDTQEALADAENRANQSAATPSRQGPLPREEELLALSEDLELRERRQLQEDEQTLMEQMRQMEVSMARERAEMARQRNDLQRLYGEIRHELERLERNGALQSKIEGLKNKLQDANNRRGAAPMPGQPPAPAPAPAPAAAPAPPAAPSRRTP